MYMNLSTFANQVGLSDEELTDHLIDRNEKDDFEKKIVFFFISFP